MLEALAEFVELADREMLGEGMVATAFERLKEIMGDSEARRRERNKRRHAEDFDAEELEALEMENEAEEEVADQVGASMGAFLKKFGDAALPAVETLMEGARPRGRRPPAPHA